MRGIYVHVPFCKSRCIYCDFYSTTCGAKEQEEFLEALENEAQSQGPSPGLPRGKGVDSLYVGGGTPSALSLKNLERLFGIVYSWFEVSKDAEVTIEVNPNDVTEELAELLSRLGVNRVSMGVQTFDDRLLRFLGRRHTEKEVYQAIERLQKAGIENLSIDLIYGLPNQTLEQWQKDLEKAFSLPITHLSAYALMFEEGTRLYEMLQRGEVQEADEELSLRMYKALCQRAKEEGFEHYEISNFCRPGRQARHNTGYWEEMHYIGLGPGAHSYDGKKRWWNKPDLQAYIRVRGRVLENGLREEEILTPEILCEEMIMKSLRTARGLDLEAFAERFGEDRCEELLARALPYINNKYLTKQGNRLALTEEGIFISNEIISSLF